MLCVFKSMNSCKSMKSSPSRSASLIIFFTYSLVALQPKELKINLNSSHDIFPSPLVSNFLKKSSRYLMGGCKAGVNVIRSTAPKKETVEDLGVAGLEGVERLCCVNIFLPKNLIDDNCEPDWSREPDSNSRGELGCDWDDKLGCQEPLQTHLSSNSMLAESNKKIFRLHSFLMLCKSHVVCIREIIVGDV